MCVFVCMCLLLTKMKGCVAKAAVWRDWMKSFRDIEHDRINTESKWRTQRNFCWAHVRQRNTAFLCFLLLTRSLEHAHCRCYLYTFFSNAIFLPKSFFFYLITHTHTQGHTISSLHLLLHLLTHLPFFSFYSFKHFHRTNHFSFCLSVSLEWLLNHSFGFQKTGLNSSRLFLFSF